MKTAYIVSPFRSAVTKAFRGGFALKRPDDLCADVIKGVLERTQAFDHSLIDDVIVGCAMPEAEQGINVARVAALLAGLPDSVPGVTINRFCSSGVQSIAMAADQIRVGSADCILAGGTESMSLIPMMGNKVVGSRRIMEQRPDIYLSMGITAENVAKDFSVSRDQQDIFAYESHQKAIKAMADGKFKDEIIPVSVESRTPGADGSPSIKQWLVESDDGPRADTSVAALGQLKPVFLQGGTVTAGTSSQMSDGAGMCLVCSEEFVTRHNLKPIARFVAFSVAGVDPRIMGIGPVSAIPKALKQGGLKLGDISWIELNEAFAAQAIAVIKSCNIDPNLVNPQGGAIALGHPLGATGAKLTATLLHGMQREKQKYGMVTMCIGTGMGAACLFEAL